MQASPDYMGACGALCTHVCLMLNMPSFNVAFYSEGNWAHADAALQMQTQNADAHAVVYSGPTCTIYHVVTFGYCNATAALADEACMGVHVHAHVHGRSPARLCRCHMQWGGFPDCHRPIDESSNALQSCTVKLPLGNACSECMNCPRILDYSPSLSEAARRA